MKSGISIPSLHCANHEHTYHTGDRKRRGLLACLIKTGLKTPLEIIDALNRTRKNYKPVNEIYKTLSRDIYHVRRNYMRRKTSRVYEVVVESSSSSSDSSSSSTSSSSSSESSSDEN